MTLKGEIVGISTPFSWGKDRSQILKIRRSKGVFAKAELLNNLNLLNGFKVGDNVEITYNLKSAYRRTVIIKTIDHGANVA